MPACEEPLDARALQRALRSERAPRGGDWHAVGAGNYLALTTIQSQLARVVVANAPDGAPNAFPKDTAKSKIDLAKLSKGWELDFVVAISGLLKLDEVQCLGLFQYYRKKKLLDGGDIASSSAMVKTKSDKHPYGYWSPDSRGATLKQRPSQTTQLDQNVNGQPPSAVFDSEEIWPTNPANWNFPTGVEASGYPDDEPVGCYPEMYSGDVLLDLCEEYYDRRDKFLLLIEEVLYLHCANSDDNAGTVNAEMTAIVQDCFSKEGLVDNCRQSLQELFAKDATGLELHVRRGLLESKSKINVEFQPNFKRRFQEMAKQQVAAEQLHVLDIMFWAFYDVHNTMSEPDVIIGLIGMFKEQKFGEKISKKYGDKCVLLLLESMHLNHVGRVHEKVQKAGANPLKEDLVEAFRQHSLFKDFPACCNENGAVQRIHVLLLECEAHPLTSILLLAWGSLLKSMSDQLDDDGASIFQDDDDFKIFTSTNTPPIHLGKCTSDTTAANVACTKAQACACPWQEATNLIRRSVPDAAELVLPFSIETLEILHGEARDCYHNIIREVFDEVFRAFGEVFLNTANNPPQIALFSSLVAEIFKRDSPQKKQEVWADLATDCEEEHGVEQAVQMAERIVTKQCIPLLQMLSAMTSSPQNARSVVDYLEKPLVTTYHGKDFPELQGKCKISQNSTGSTVIDLTSAYCAGSLTLPINAQGTVSDIKDEQYPHKITWTQIYFIQGHFIQRMEYSLMSAFKDRLQTVCTRAGPKGTAAESLTMRQVEEASCIVELLAKLVWKEGVPLAHSFVPLQWDTGAQKLVKKEEMGLVELCRCLTTLLHTSTTLTLQCNHAEQVPVAAMLGLAVQIAAHVGCLLLITPSHIDLEITTGMCPRTVGFVAAAKLIRDREFRAAVVAEHAVMMCAQAHGDARDMMVVAAAVATAVELYIRPGDARDAGFRQRVVVNAGEAAAIAAKNNGKVLFEVAQAAEAAAAAMELIFCMLRNPSDRNEVDEGEVKAYMNQAGIPAVPADFYKKVVATAHVASACLSKAPGSPLELLFATRPGESGCFASFDAFEKLYKNLILKPPLPHEHDRTDVITAQYYEQTCAAAVALRRRQFQSQIELSHRMSRACLAGLGALAYFADLSDAMKVVAFVLHDDLDRGVFHDLNQVHNYEVHTSHDYIATLEGVKLLSATLQLTVHMTDERAARLTGKSVEFALHILAKCDGWAYTKRTHQWLLKLGALMLLQQVMQLRECDVQQSLLEHCLTDPGIAAAIHKAAGWLGVSALPPPKESGLGWVWHNGNYGHALKLAMLQQVLDTVMLAGNKDTDAMQDEHEEAKVDFEQGFLSIAEEFEDVLLEHVTKSALVLIKSILTAGGLRHRANEKVALLMKCIQLGVIDHNAENLQQQAAYILGTEATVGARNLVNAIASYSYKSLSLSNVDLSLHAVQVLTFLSKCISFCPTGNDHPRYSITKYLGAYKFSFKRSLLKHLNKQIQICDDDAEVVIEDLEESGDTRKDDQLQIAVLQLASVSLDAQPGLASLLLDLAAPEEEAQGGANTPPTQVVNGPVVNGPERLFQWALDRVGEMNEIGDGCILQRQPRLLAATLEFVSSLWEGAAKGLAQHAGAVNAFRALIADTTSNFWANLVKLFKTTNDKEQITLLEKIKGLTAFMKLRREAKGDLKKLDVESMQDLLSHYLMETTTATSKAKLLEELKPHHSTLGILSPLDDDEDDALTKEEAKLHTLQTTSCHRFAALAWCLRIISFEWYHYEVTAGKDALYNALKEEITAPQVAIMYHEVTQFDFESIGSELLSACQQCGLTLEHMDRFRRPCYFYSVYRHVGDGEDDEASIVLQEGQRFGPRFFYDTELMAVSLMGVIAQQYRTQLARGGVTPPSLFDRNNLIRAARTVNTKISRAHAQLALLENWRTFVCISLLPGASVAQVPALGITNTLACNAPANANLTAELGPTALPSLLDHLIENVEKYEHQGVDVHVARAIEIQCQTLLATLRGCYHKHWGGEHLGITSVDECAELLGGLSRVFGKVFGSVTTMYVDCGGGELVKKTTKSGTAAELRADRVALLTLRVTLWTCVFFVLARLEKIYVEYKAADEHLPKISPEHQHILPHLLQHCCVCLRLPVVLQPPDNNANFLFVQCANVLTSLARLQRLATKVQVFVEFASISFIDQLLEQRALETVLVAFGYAGEEAATEARKLEAIANGAAPEPAEMVIDVHEAANAALAGTNGPDDGPHTSPGPRAELRLETLHQMLLTIAGSGGRKDGTSAGKLVEYGLIPAMCTNAALLLLLERSQSATTLGANTIVDSDTSYSDFDTKQSLLQNINTKPLTPQEARRWWGYTISNEKKPLQSRSADRCKIHVCWCLTLQVMTAVLCQLGPHLSHLPGADPVHSQEVLVDQIDRFVNLFWPLLQNALTPRTATLAGLHETEHVLAFLACLVGKPWWKNVHPENFARLMSLVGPKVVHLTVLMGTGPETKSSEWETKLVTEQNKKKSGTRGEAKDAHVVHNRRWHKVVRSISAIERESNPEGGLKAVDKEAKGALEEQEGDDVLASVLHTNISFIRATESATTKVLRWAVMVLVKLTPPLEVKIMGENVVDNESALPILELHPDIDRLVDPGMIDTSKKGGEGEGWTGPMSIGHLVLLTHFALHTYISWRDDPNNVNKENNTLILLTEGCIQLLITNLELHKKCYAYESNLSFMQYVERLGHALIMEDASKDPHAEKFAVLTPRFPLLVEAQKLKNSLDQELITDAWHCVEHFIEDAKDGNSAVQMALDGNGDADGQLQAQVMNALGGQ
jgi:hypothetical protein